MRTMGCGSSIAFKEKMRANMQKCEKLKKMRTPPPGLNHASVLIATNKCAFSLLLRRILLDKPICHMPKNLERFLPGNCQGFGLPHCSKIDNG